ncbi:hypothetical protein SELMODRAFT_269431 [Selaginella moellendorffii]|uniref:Deoxyhypusine hydroxylase n=1 Tax=Selaginella moellendorffii TaxID=88036 RepID=D8SZC6_SELML|nr:deoxyhypusine hydroxylase-B [Selaginella moellendorffii]EFJ10188.1 hypothetical protein SELMODRAFT_269431 [Selaginella moellendorffii]|eukprot:XP_002988677.1 deoxyhypusine hydroxylase-B [Selaginella moellendorffii]
MVGVAAVKDVGFLLDRLLDPKQPISERFRVLFAIRNHHGDASRSALIAAMRDPSNLLAHEAAFALGQMQDPVSIAALREILCDVDGAHPIVRHEAAEAMGAIGDPSCVDLLRSVWRSDPAREVRETCELALHRIEISSSNSNPTNEDRVPKFLSVDPMLPASGDSSTSQLRQLLLDDSLPMHERYAALFALRNRGDRESTDAIAAALETSKSALLKHEVAYVLGQLQDMATVEILERTLGDPGEHPMVRHEAAEALGSIADPNCVELLTKFLDDPEPIVHQSCEVALSMLEFEQQGKPFEYLFQEIKVGSE